jgi:hypothetical protein
MLSYVYFGTNDLGKAIAFYNATLASVAVPLLPACPPCAAGIHVETRA